MEETALDFDDFAEILFQQSADDGYSSGKERQLRRAADKDLRVLVDNAQNRAISRQIDAKRLFPEQMFPRPDNVRIKMPVQVMGYGTIDGLHAPASDQSV